MNKSLLILLALISQVCFAQNECYSDGPVYYATKDISVYESMSINSAISLDVPKGEKVIVVESFFGDDGWWKICYEGESGWVKKANLTRKKPIFKTPPIKEIIEEEVIDSTGDGIEVNFNPFLGKTNASANFRTAPSKTYSHIIKKLPLGTQLYIFSDETKNNFYKVIDIKSSKIGWISKDLISKTKNVDINSTGAFVSTGSTSDYKSSVLITNKSSSKITLIVGGETFGLGPKSKENVSVSPGKKYYIATSPGVIPASGYQNFDEYHGYKWEFWIETTHY